MRHLVLISFYSSGCGTLPLGYYLHLSSSRMVILASVSFKGDDLLMNSLVNSMSSKDVNSKTQYLYSTWHSSKASWCVSNARDFKRLHTETVQWRRLAGASLHCLKFAVNILVAWKMVQVPSPVTIQRGTFRKTWNAYAQNLWSQFLSMFPKRVHRSSW